MTSTTELVVDAHVHLGKKEHWNPAVVRSWFEPFGLDPGLVEIDTDQIVANLDAVGAKWAVALAFDCARHLAVHVPNEYVVEECARHPGRFVPFASVDPISRTAPEVLRDAIENLGMRGLKLAPTYQDFHPQAPAAMKVYETCVELDIPVLFHQGWTGNRFASVSLQHAWLLDDVAIALPDLKIVVAHLGMPEQRHTLHMMARHRNVYADLSGRDLPGYGGGARTMFDDVSDAIDLGVEDKLFWGTDYPWTEQADSLGTLRTLNDHQDPRRPPIPDEVLEGIVGANVERLLGDPSSA